MVEKTSFFCVECNKEINIPRNLISKLEKKEISINEAIKKAQEKHDHKFHALIQGIKFKLYINDSEIIKNLNNYFDEYAKAVIFAANVINKLRSPFAFVGKKENNKWIFPKDKCDFCKKETDIAYISKRSKKICNSCYQKEFGENGIRKKLYATRGRKVNPNYNIFNATKKLSPTHYNFAIREAFQLLEANKKQRSQRIKRLKRDKRRLKEFEEMLENPEKRIELPLKEKQREKRYIHISQKEIADELRGYTIKKIQERIKVLRRNIEREEKSLRKKSPIIFKGNRIMIPPSQVKFNTSSNKVKITIGKKKNLPEEFKEIASEEYDFSGTNVANFHGKKFFEEKLKNILNQKPKYAYIIRKQINKDKENPIYDYYLQYTIETIPKIKKDYDGVIGIDRGSNPNLAVLVFLEKNKEKPSLVRFIKGKDIVSLKIKRRKQLYFLRGKHHKRKKEKRIRPIERRIKQILHTRAKEIVQLAKEKNAAIALEQLEKIKKSKPRQRKVEKYRYSLFNFKTLSTFIEYKARKEGIKVLYVPPERTSQICSHCAIKGKLHSNTQRPYKKPNAKKPSYSLFKCNECGIELNADYNAAFNIAQKGLKSLGM